MGSAALAALAVLGGCASAPPPSVAEVRGQGIAQRSPPVACTTTWLVLATVSKCGADGMKFGVATE
jgi:hypothetical protein